MVWNPAADRDDPLNLYIAVAVRPSSLVLLVFICILCLGSALLTQQISVIGYTLLQL